MAFEQEQLDAYRRAAKEGTGVPIPRSPIEERQERISNRGLSQESVEGMARAVIPAAVQTVAEFTPVGRAARFGQAIHKAAPFLRDVGAGLLGYEANVAAGLEEQDTREAIKAGAVPAGARVAAGAAKGVTTHLPGSSVIKQERAVEQLQERMYIPLGPDKADDLYKQIKGNPIVPAAKLRKELDAIESELANITHPELLKDAQATLALTKGFRERIDDLQAFGGVPFQEMWANMRGLSMRLDKLKTAGGPEFRHATMLKQSVQESLEDAGKLPGAQYKEIAAANKLYRREKASETFADVIDKQGFSHVQTQYGEFVEVTPNRVLNWMKDPKQEFWRGGLEKGELKDIETFLHELSRVPKTGRGNWMDIVQKVGYGGIAGGVAHSSGADPATTAAVSAGALSLPSLIAKAVLTPRGRWIVGGLIRETGRHIPTHAVTIFAAALRAHLHRESPEVMAREGQTRMPVEQ